MSTVIKIYNESAGAWHDWSDVAKRSGIGWTRNDLDEESSGRTLD